MQYNQHTFVDLILINILNLFIYCVLFCFFFVLISDFRCVVAAAVHNWCRLFLFSELIDTPPLSLKAWERMYSLAYLFLDKVCCCRYRRRFIVVKLLLLLSTQAQMRALVFWFLICMCSQKKVFLSRVAPECRKKNAPH